jgi:hypothetical protein
MSMITVTLELAVSDKLCKDLLTTCVEGGSAYWLACETVEREPDLDVIKIVGCYDVEDEDTKWGDATVETMREGIRRLLSGEVKVNAATRQNILAAVVDSDAADWDAGDADSVLQAGLLKDIVYG